MKRKSVVTVLPTAPIVALRSGAPNIASATSRGVTSRSIGASRFGDASVDGVARDATSGGGNCGPADDRDAAAALWYMRYQR